MHLMRPRGQHETGRPSGRPRDFLAAIALFLTVVTLGGAGVGACDGDAEQPLVFEGQDPLLPGFSFDTGLVPSGAPVQASFSVSADGSARVHAEAAASGSLESPTLTGTPGSGELSVAGGFGLEGRLVVDITGLPSYDGPIPGIENVAIEFASTSAFDPFSIGAPVTTRADIPPAELPPIPLPGGIPGSLVLEVAEGSFLEVTMTGVQACVAPDEAQYGVALERRGTLVIRPHIEVDVPIVGTQTFEIPVFEVPLALEGSILAMSAPATFGAQPAAGDHVSGRCDGMGPSAAATGGGSAGGGSATGGAGTGGSATGGRGPSCMSKDECGGLPCVEGTCSSGDGVCQAGISFGDVDFDACVSLSCCTELETCTYDYADLEGCNSCLDALGGDRCDGLLACLGASCDVWTCEEAHYGSDDGCDCGCGVLDPDCADALVETCEFCDSLGSCGTAPCPANIDPTNNAVCL